MRGPERPGADDHLEPAAGGGAAPEPTPLHDVPPPSAEPPVVEWPAVGPLPGDRRVGAHPLRETARAALQRGRSPWPGRVIAGAAGAGLMLVGLALRDALPLRRSTPPPPPLTLRRRIGSWLRGEDR